MGRNTTDYEFPEMWGQMTDEQKAEWYLRRRVYKQAIRQTGTAFADRHKQAVAEAKRTDTDQYKYDP